MKIKVAIIQNLQRELAFGVCYGLNWSLAIHLKCDPCQVT